MERILIYQTAFLGDLLLAIPLIRQTRILFPTSEIHLACRSPLGNLFLATGLVNHVHEIKKDDPQSRREFEAELLAKHWSLVICAHRSTRSHLLMMRLKTQRRIGFYKWWSAWRFTETVIYNPAQPDVLRQLSLLSPLSANLRSKLDTYQPGIRRQALRSPSARDAKQIQVPEWASMTLPKIDIDQFPIAQAWTADSSPWIFIAPGSQWNTKRWTIEGFREVAQDALAKGKRVIAVGSQSERQLIDQLNITDQKFHNLGGMTSLIQLLALFQRGEVLISNDSGSMHLASCAECPTIAIFGPTVLGLGYEPWQDRARVVERDLVCRPCGKHGHDQCPIGTHACMKQISPGAVIDRARIVIPH